MGVFGALGKFVMSLGRELFGSAARGTDGIVELAEKLGVKMDALQDSSPEKLASVMDTAVRQRLIDPRDANNVKIELAKDAQRAMPASSSEFFEAMGDEGALTEFSGIGNLVDTYVYKNSQQALKDAMSDPDYNIYRDVLKTNLNKTFPSGKIPVRRAENYLTKRPEEDLGNKYKTINAEDISFASNISENEVIVKEGEKFTSYFIDDAQKQYKDSFNIDAAHGQGDSNTSTGTVNVPMGDGKVREMGVEFEPGRTLLADENMGINRFEEVSDKMNETLDPNNLGTWFGGYNSRGEPDVANFFAGRGGDDAAGAVYPVKLRIENPKIFDRYEDFEDEMREWSEMAEEGGTDVTSQAFVKDLQDQGHDGIMIERSDTDTGEVRSDYVPFNANQIRSIFAKFDPSKKDSGNISASIAGGAVGLGALQSVRGDDGNLQR